MPVVVFVGCDFVCGCGFICGCGFGCCFGCCRSFKILLSSSMVLREVLFGGLAPFDFFRGFLKGFPKLIYFLRLLARTAVTVSVARKMGDPPNE